MGTGKIGMGELVILSLAGTPICLANLIQRLSMFPKMFSQNEVHSIPAPHTLPLMEIFAEPSD